MADFLNQVDGVKRLKNEATQGTSHPNVTRSLDLFADMTVARNAVITEAK